MTRTHRLDLLFLAALAVAALAFLPRAAGVEVPLFSDPVVYAVGAGGKLAFLLLGFVFAALSARRFEPGNPARRPWALFSTGLGSYALGQATILHYQLVLEVPIPFPSLADVFFLGAVVGFTLALIGFLVAFRSAGFLLASPGKLLLQGLVAAAGLGLVGAWLLGPVYHAEGSTLERFLNLAYPISDLVLMVPAVLLLIMAWRFSGGRVARVWFALLLGLVLLAAGDVAFAYLTTMGQERLDPLVDFLFLGSYILLARATLEQAELLGSGEPGQ